MTHVAVPGSQRLFAAYADFIPEFAAFCAAVHREPLCCLRVNTLRRTPAQVKTGLAAKGYNVTSSSVAPELLLVSNLSRPGSLYEALLGYCQPQALTSAMASLVLDPQPGERVCDLCAAPGSKTAHMAQLMQDQGLIVANDRHGKRLSLLEHNLKRLGMSNVVTTCYAGQNFPLRCKFDRVLVDAPCSGEGTYRWDERGRLQHYRRSEGDLPRLQKQLLLRGFDLLAEQGSLLYSTCTYNPDENEAVVQYLLEQRPALLQPIGLNAPHRPGLGQWRALTYDSSMERCWRLYPHDTHSVGFFLAHIRRATSTQ
ncbi:MAG: RsmB/NOP family class I SAM-dependent RNA methyltransferase [bacterium]|nr:RsmB/NOP family class I SAM-dependent RNA methyltransferase [bacterium]